MAGLQCTTCSLVRPQVVLRASKTGLMMWVTVNLLLQVHTTIHAQVCAVSSFFLCMKRSAVSILACAHTEQPKPCLSGMRPHHHPGQGMRPQGPMGVNWNANNAGGDRGGNSRGPYNSSSNITGSKHALMGSVQQQAPHPLPGAPQNGPRLRATDSDFEVLSPAPSLLCQIFRLPLHMIYRCANICCAL